MRRLLLSTPLPAGADRAWSTLIDTPRWPEWGRLVTSAQGELTPGARWRMTLADPPRTMRPRLVSIAPPRKIIFETIIGARFFIRLEHVFEVESDSAERSVLRQSFSATGMMVPVLWGSLERGMKQFAALGDDLARRLDEPGR